MLSNNVDKYNRLYFKCQLLLKIENLFFSSDVTVFSLHEQHDTSLNFWFRTHIILEKCTLAHSHAERGRLRHVSASRDVRIIGTLVPFV